MNCKAVEYAYPSSDVACRFKLGHVGCYYVSFGSGIATKPVAGFKTAREAHEYASAIPGPWSRYTLNADGAFVDLQSIGQFSKGGAK